MEPRDGCNGSKIFVRAHGDICTYPVSRRRGEHLLRPLELPSAERGWVESWAACLEEEKLD